MSGSISGGKQASITNKILYGDDFYARIGSMGGKASGTGGFFANRELASRAGKIGGERSSRLGIKTGQGKKSYAKTMKIRDGGGND